MIVTLSYSHIIISQPHHVYISLPYNVNVGTISWPWSKSQSTPQANNIPPHKYTYLAYPTTKIRSSPLILFLHDHLFHLYISRCQIFQTNFLCSFSPTTPSFAPSFSPQYIPACYRALLHALAVRQLQGSCRRSPGAAWTTTNAPMPPELAIRWRVSSLDLTHSSLELRRGSPMPVAHSCRGIKYS